MKRFLLLEIIIYVAYAVSKEKAMTPHSSTLAWKIPWTEEPGGLQSMGSLRVGHKWSSLVAAAAACCFKIFFYWLHYFPCAEDISQAMDTMNPHFFNEYCLLFNFLFFLCIFYFNYSHINLIFEVLFEFIWNFIVCFIIEYHNYFQSYFSIWYRCV